LLEILERTVKKFWQSLAFLLATFSGAFAAPNGSIQSDVAICDPNNASYCEAFAGTIVTSTQITCTTAGTVQALESLTTSKSRRFISNTSGATVYLGANGVSSTTGFPLPTGTTLDVTKLTAALYCATASSTAVIGTLEY